MFHFETRVPIRHSERALAFQNEKVVVLSTFSTNDPWHLSMP